MMNQCRILLYLVLAVSMLHGFYASGQDVSRYHYTVENGLPSSEVYDIIQDSRGYMWFATDRGVSRFDGYRFRNFTSNDGLTDNTVFKLVEDHKNRIWFITNNAQLCYFLNDSIIPYRFNNILQKNILNSKKPLLSFNISRDETVTVGQYNNGFILIDAAGRIIPDSLTGRNASGNSYRLHADDGRLKYAICKNNPGKDSITIDYTNGNRRLHSAISDASTGYSTALLTRDSTLYVALSNLLHIFSKEGTHIQIAMPANVIRLFENDDGTILAGLVQEGLLRISGSRLQNRGDFNPNFKGKTVTCVFVDREKNYWYATLESGVYFQPHNTIETRFAFPESNGQRVTDITGHGNKVFVSFMNGEIACFEHKRLLKTISCNRAGEPVNPVFEICYLPAENKLIVGTATGAFSCNPEDEKTTFRSLPLRLNTIRDMCRNEKDSLYIATIGTITNFQSGKTFLLENRVDHIYYDNQFGLLMGSINGILCIRNDSVISFMPGIPQLRSRISGIVRLSADTLAVATIGQGLLLITPHGLRKFTAADGLSTDIINAITIGTGGTLWLGMNKSVHEVRFQNDSIRVNTYTVAHGLPSDEVRQIGFYSGLVWAGTPAGIAILDPPRLKRSSIPPPVYITGATVNGTPRKPYTEQRFEYNQNVIEIAFTGLSFQSLGNMLYKYKLDGNGGYWNYTRNTSVNFTGLEPGTYTFLVAARNTDGVWSTAPAEFRFIIRKPFWRTWWFNLLCMMLLTGIAWLIIRQRIKRLKEKEALRRRVSESQQKALAAQMNPHFIFNSLNSIQAFVLGDDKEQVLKYINRFSVLMRKSLENSSEQMIPLSSDIEVLCAYLELEKMRFKNRFKFELYIDPAIRVAETIIPGMLMQPYVENALKHGILHRTDFDGHISIRLFLENDKLFCSIRDNGIGRAASEKRNAASLSRHQPMGTAITGERLKLLCEAHEQPFIFEIKDHYNADGTATGTTVYFLIPYLNHHDHT